jgi:hypothetical protein
LMAHALGVSRSDLLLRHMASEAPAAFAELVERRMGHEPVAYITGCQEFYGLPFQVTCDVLIPRGDSEVLVDRAIHAKPKAARVLDCGTGSGALLLSVLAHLRQAHGIGIDRSQATLGIATANAAALGLDDRARMLVADWTRPGWSEALGRFDLVLANPPYVEVSICARLRAGGGTVCGCRRTKRLSPADPAAARLAGARRHRVAGDRRHSGRRRCRDRATKWLCLYFAPGPCGPCQSGRINSASVRFRLEYRATPPKSEIEPAYGR